MLIAAAVQLKVEIKSWLEIMSTLLVYGLIYRLKKNAFMHGTSWMGPQPFLKQILFIEPGNGLNKE